MEDTVLAIVRECSGLEGEGLFVLAEGKARKRDLAFAILWRAIFRTIEVGPAIEAELGEIGCFF